MRGYRKQQITFKTMTEKQYPDVCVVTHPLSAAGENATRSLLDILSEISNIRLVTADLPAGSVIRDEYEVIELVEQKQSESLLRTTFQFVYNQIQMCREIRQIDDELILFFGATSYLLPILLAQILGKVVVLMPRGNVPLTLQLKWEQQIPDLIARTLAKMVWILERVGYWLSDAIVTYTPSMAQELRLGQFENKLYPTGARYINTNQFYPRIPFNQRNKVVGFLGRLDEEKNVRVLAAAVKKLPDDVTFRFIGDGPIREELEHELDNEIAAGKIDFTGWVDHSNVPEELSQLQLLVLPSEPTEGLPTVILEAMACGTPALATPVSGVPDVVQDGETGFLLRDHSPENIAEQIQYALYKTTLENISESATKEINQKYTLNTAVNRYRIIFSELSF